MKNPSFLSETEVIKKFNISKATLKNWIKQGRLVYNQGNGFDYEDINNFYYEMVNGNGKLDSRANKKFSNKTFIPSEYLSVGKNYDDIVKILSISNKLNLDLENVLVYTAYRLLELEGSLLIKNNGIEFVDKYLEQDVTEIFPRFQFEGNIYEHFRFLNGKFQDDFLGALYQSIKNEGEKSSGGSYYTPKFLVEDIIKDVINSGSKVLDPCCGTGQFLITSAQIIKSPENICGFDIDKIAVGIARINLHLIYGDKSFRARIYCKNTLSDDRDSLFHSTEKELFDVVITNPPWGASFDKEEKKYYKKLFPEISTTESFSYFLVKGLDFLKKGGDLVYILPESFLYVGKHTDIRKYILKNTSITAIYHLGRIFKGVFSPVVRIDIKKELSQQNKIYSRDNCGEYTTKQSLLLSSESHKLNVFLSEQDRTIIEKIYTFPSISLKDNAIWALGIVTGDNKKFITNKSMPNNEPIIKGSDIKKYILKKSNNFITFEPSKFQQVAPTDIYSFREKLMYKWISKKLIFAYDDRGLLTLNSANILIPQIKDYPIKTILALLNSSLYQYLFQKEFNTIKVLRGDLEKMPFPILNSKQHLFIKEVVNKILQDNKDRIELLVKIDNYIMDIFSLTEKEKLHINKLNKK